MKSGAYIFIDRIGKFYNELMLNEVFGIEVRNYSG